MFSTKSFENGNIILMYGEYLGGGPCIKAFSAEGPYAAVSTFVPDIPCEENQIVLDHNLPVDGEFVRELKQYLAKDSVPVCFGPFRVRSELITLKDDWKELCVPL